MKIFNTIICDFRKVILLLLFLSVNFNLKAQYNFVPNFDFSNGRENPACVYDYCDGSEGIETDIYYWYNALTHPNCSKACNATFFRQCPTSDWLDQNCQYGQGVPFTNSDRFVGMVTSPTSNDWREGVGVRLPFKLPSGKYVIRFKVATQENDSGDNLQLSAHLTKWEVNWNSNRKGNTKMKYIKTFNIGGLSNRWHLVVAQFEVSQNKSNEMDVLTIVRDMTTMSSHGKYLYADQVELYPYCPGLLLFQNREFNMLEDFPYEAEVIKRGRII